MSGNYSNLTMNGAPDSHLPGSHRASNTLLKVRAAAVGPAGADALGVLRVFALQSAKAVLGQLEASRKTTDARLGELIAEWEENAGTSGALICLRRASDNTHARLTWRRRGQAKTVVELDQLTPEEQKVTDMRLALRLEEERLVQNLRFSCLGYEIQRLAAFIGHWRKLQNLRRQFFPPRSRRI